MQALLLWLTNFIGRFLSKTEAKMLKQTDPRLLPEINAYGCFFMSIITAAQMSINAVFSPEKINALWKSSIQLKILIDNGGFWVLDKPHELGLLACENKVKVFANVMVVPGWTPDWYTDHTWVILKGRTKNGVHYRLGAKNGGLIYDPDPQAVILEELTKEYYLVR